MLWHKKWADITIMSTFIRKKQSIKILKVNYNNTYDFSQDYLKLDNKSIVSSQLTVSGASTSVNI